MCVAVLVKASQLLEADDYAYRASIVALREGHVLLSNAQHLAPGPMERPRCQKRPPRLPIQ
jgi:hypothetical protein